MGNMGKIPELGLPIPWLTFKPCTSEKQVSESGGTA